MIFDPLSFWNKKLLDNELLSPNSNTYVKELVQNVRMKDPWINTTSYTTPLYYVNDLNVPKVPVLIMQNGQELTFTLIYKELKTQGVRIPENAIPSSGSDGHLTLYDLAEDTLYEFWQLRKDATLNSWVASWAGFITQASQSIGIMPTMTNEFGDDEFWGATATSLPAIGGTMLIPELASGVIPHALAIACIRPKKDVFVWPAQRTDGTSTLRTAIPEGTRFRWPANITINPSWCPIVKMIVTAGRDYGIVVRDKSGATVFYAEDYRQYGTTNPYTQYYNGLQLWDVMKQIPFDKLQVLA